MYILSSGPTKAIKFKESVSSSFAHVALNVGKGGVGVLTGLLVGILGSSGGTSFSGTISIVFVLQDNMKKTRISR